MNLLWEARCGKTARRVLLGVLGTREKSRGPILPAKKFPELDISKMLQSFHQSMAFDQTKVSRAEFEANLAGKLNDEAFVNDIFPLLPPEFNIADYHPITDVIPVHERIINQLPGDGWKGKPM